MSEHTGGGPLAGVRVLELGSFIAGPFAQPGARPRAHQRVRSDRPRSSSAGFGSVGEAMGGLRFTTGSPDRPPARAGISLGDTVFGRLCTAMGRPELASDPRFSTHVARGERMAELDALIAGWSAGLPTADLLARLEHHGVPAGQIFTAKEMLTDPHCVARDMVRRVVNRRPRPAAAEVGQDSVRSRS